MKTLEDQVRTLAEQVILLRSELKAMRDARSPGQRAEDRVLLTASHVVPGMLATPAPAAAPTRPSLLRPRPLRLRFLEAHHPTPNFLIRTSA